MSRPIHRRWVTGLAAAALAVSVSACADPGANSSPTGSGQDGASGKTVAFIGYGAPNPWATYFNEVYFQGIEDAGVEVRDLSTLDPGTQVQNMNQAIAEKPDLIVLGVLDPQALVPSIQRAAQAGIPVLAYDSKVDPSVQDDVMGVYSDNEQLGEFAAQNLVEGLQAQGRTSGNIFLITGSAAGPNTQDRLAGFQRIMAQNPGYTVVATEDGQWDPTTSGQLAQQLLARYGADGVQGAYGMADYMAIPIIQAAQQLGIPVGGADGLVVTSSNCFASGIDAIDAGTLYGSATQDPGSIAQQTAEYTVNFLDGKDQEQVVTVDEGRITAATVDQYREQCTAF